MKKFLCIVLTALMALTLLAGCGGTAAPADSGKTTYKVGILQYMQHPSLDEISAAIVAELQSLADQNGLVIEIDLENAQGDQTNISTITNQFVSDGVDVVIAVATPAAQGAAAVLEGSNIPLIFSAVTDPVAAQLVESMEAPGGTITGTSDYIPTDDIFKLAGLLTPEAKTFGLMYCTSEVNSISVIAEAKSCLDATEGASYEEGAVTTVADVQNVAQVLLSRTDAVFVPIDNTVASGMSVLAEEAIRAKKPVYVSADSMVKDGGLASIGCNYTALGSITADMAFCVLSGVSPATMPVEVLTERNVVVNLATAEAIGITRADIEALSEALSAEITLVGTEGEA